VRVARVDRLHPHDLDPLLGHRHRGLESTAEPARGLARRESDLHAPRNPLASLLSDLATPARMGGDREAAARDVRGPLGPRGAGTRTVHEFRGRRRPSDPFGGRGARCGLVALRMEGALVYGRPFAMGWIDAAIALPTSLHRAFPPRSYVRAFPSRK